MIRVILVDDHTLLRAGIRALLQKQPDFLVVNDVGDAEAAWATVVEERPDLLVLDLNMPGGGALGLIERLQKLEPAPKILILSMHDDPSYAKAALAAGATGYVVKTIGEQDLVNAMRIVSTGRLFIDLDDPGRTKSVLFDGKGAVTTARPPAKLSAREVEVLRLLGQGHTNQAVADQLELSAKTVATYRARITEKLGIKTTAEIVKYVAETGL